VEITGAGPAGAYYGTRTLLQQLRGPQHAVPGGEITDWPEYPQRGLMVDAGRKYFTPEWHAARIRELGWLKLNTYHLHLSDGSGFRLESETHPEIVTRPALSRAEVLELLDLAERHHVTVIPEIDTPGHLEAALAAHPDLQLVTAAGRRHPSNLDYSKPEARAFAHDLIGEIAELFPGPLVHLGGDEYFGYPWDTENKITGENCPQLLDHARREAGPDATLLDGFTHYQNGLIELLGRHGKQAVVWNDHLEPAEGVVELDHRAQVESWIRWNEQLPSAADLLDAGYGIINGHGDHLYFIVNVGQQHEEGKKSAQGIYDLWDPLVFMAAPTRDFRLPAKPAGHRGAHLSVWCDNPGFQTEQEIAEGLRSWLRSFGQQLWGSPRAAADFAAFRPMIDAVGGPPAAAG
jgi:hexosaminidase